MSKNLANCKPSEFLVQTNKIRKSVEKWLEVTDIVNIRKHVPKLKDFPDNASTSDIEKIKEENKRLLAEQSKKNISEILDSIMDKHPKESLELIALLCFVDPKNVDDNPVSFYLENITELINDESVMGFFTSLVQLAQMDILS